MIPIIRKKCKYCKKKLEPLKAKGHGSRLYHPVCFRKARSKYQMAWAKKRPDVVRRRKKKYRATERGKAKERTSSTRAHWKQVTIRKIVNGKSFDRILRGMQRRSVRREGVLTFR